MDRKLEVGATFRVIFHQYGQQAGLLLPAALIVFVPVAILDALILDAGRIELQLLSSLIAVIATFWYQGMVVEAVRDSLDGRRDLTLGRLIGSVTPAIGTLIVTGSLAGLGILVGFLLLIVPGLVLLTWWALISPVVVVERPGVLAAFGRSRELVRGHAWQVFAVIVVLSLLLFVVTALLSVAVTLVIDTPIAQAVLGLALNVLFVPPLALAAATIYFELRRIREDQVGPAPAAEPGPA